MVINCLITKARFLAVGILTISVATQELTRLNRSIVVLITLDLLLKKERKKLIKKCKL